MLCQADVTRAQDAARDGQQMGSEREAALLQSERLEDFRHMPVAEQTVGATILINLDEMQSVAGSATGATRARFGIADHAGGKVQPARDGKRSQREDDRRGVASRIRHQLCLPDGRRVQFRKTVDSLTQRLSGMMLEPV